MEEVKKYFKNPRKEYRAVPFWAWNDKLDSEELISQAKEFKEKGIGGFFMHSRVGLETEYMGEEWLKTVEDVVKSSKEIDIDPWLYDEDRWPSGFAGGKVAEKIGDEGRAKTLCLKILRDKNEIKGTELAIYKAEISNNEIKNLKRIPKIDEVSGEEVILALYRELSKRTEWYNGDAPPDNLNPKGVKAFIENTHEVYYKRLKNEFGKTIKGIFTDEPNIFPYLWGGGPEDKYFLPWTDIFPEYFRERRGYDFFDIAPYVFFSGEKSLKARYDFWRTISELFVESYTKQISDWCKEHNILFTGHYLEENIFPHVILCSGSVMPHYEYMDIPGIDILTDSRYEYLTVKQASSVANQLSKERVISETYGCTGWEFDFAGQKHVGDWQYALGVNMRCQHLFLYSLRGCRKRDYPPSFNHNPSWKYIKLIENYFARLSYILTLG
ncbi:MAG: glycosyl hydrolase, partial [Dictyoglomus sp.]